MKDEFLTAAWADHHHRFSDDVAAALRRAATAIRIGLDRLNRYEFDAPWLRDAARKPGR